MRTVRCRSRLACENITLPQTSFAGGKKKLLSIHICLKIYTNLTLHSIQFYYENVYFCKKTMHWNGKNMYQNSHDQIFMNSYGRHKIYLIMAISNYLNICNQLYDSQAKILRRIIL